MKSIYRKVNYNEILAEHFMLQKFGNKPFFGLIVTIDESILQSLVLDFNLTEDQALELYFQSKTYRNLIDETTLLFEKNWTEIYSILCSELNLSKFPNE